MVPHNCEAAAVDPTTATVLLVTKTLARPCRVFALPLAADQTSGVLEARPIASIHIPLATAMDVSPDGRRAIVLTYLDAFQYTRDPAEGWEAAFSRPPQLVRTPPRSQGESICYGADGETLYLTSEKRPTPLWRIPVLPSTEASSSPTPPQGPTAASPPCPSDGSGAAVPPPEK